MMTSEFEYYFLQSLIGMADRELASKIELHIWKKTFVPQPKILAKYLTALHDSKDEEDFIESAKKILEESGMEFLPSEYIKADPDEQGTSTAGMPVPNEIQITAEMAFANEAQDARNYK